MDKRRIFESFLAAAQRVRDSGIYIHPVAAAAQACLETGFGRHIPLGSNNVLGIKAGKTWKGPVVNAETMEYNSGGTARNVSAWWRVYSTVDDCFADYGSLIMRLSWYQDAEDVAETADGTPRDYLEALQPVYSSDGTVLEPGYFTDPAYVDKAMAIVESYAPKPPPSFDDLYPPLEGVETLWLNNVMVARVMKARQVGSKLFVAVEPEEG